MLAFIQPTTVDKHTKISSEKISDGREYSLLFLYVKVEVSCKVVGLLGARRRLTNWQEPILKLKRVWDNSVSILSKKQRFLPLLFAWLR